MPEKSDVDLLAILPGNNLSPLQRVETLDKMRKLNASLERDLLAIMRRNDASVSITSVTPVTRFELDFGIHKGGRPDLYTASPFLDLLDPASKPSNFGRKANVPYHDYELLTQAMEKVQAQRNRYVSVTPNNSRPVRDWDDDVDAVPKELARATAQVIYFRNPVSANPEARFDMSRGLLRLENILTRLQAKDDAYTQVQHWLSVRRSGRGKRESLSPSNAMLLWEVLGVDAELALSNAMTATSQSPNRERPSATPERPQTKVVVASRPKEPPAKSVVSSEDATDMDNADEIREQFESSAQNIKKGLRYLGRVGVRVLYGYLNNDDWAPDSDTGIEYGPAIKEAVDSGFIREVEDGLRLNSRHPKVKKTIQALEELDALMRSEVFCPVAEAIEEEDAIVVEIKNREFFKAYLNPFPILLP